MSLSIAASEILNKIQKLTSSAKDDTQDEVSEAQMKQRILILGAEQLFYSQADPLAKSFAGKYVKRFPLDATLLWSEFTTEIENATHLLLIIGPTTDYDTLLRIVRNRHKKYPHVKVGVIFVTKNVPDERYMWLFQQKHINFAVARSPIEFARMNQKCLNTITATFSQSNEIAKAFLAEKRAHVATFA